MVERVSLERMSNPRDLVGTCRDLRSDAGPGSARRFGIDAGQIVRA